MIRFNFPHLVGTELEHLREVLESGRLAGDGKYTKLCSELLEDYLNSGSRVMLTHSCTAALEMAALLVDIQPGDEVIMPSYTFVSTANAFVLRGGVPVFVDIRADTLNIDESLIERAITSRTKAIVPVHYAGVACEMDAIMDIARRHKLFVIEDAAQALGSSYRGRKLGTIGDMAAFSFHETKNIISGEGGALVINDQRFSDRAEIIREKGTNRSRFFRGQVDKYTWVDVGSSYLPSELNAAFLFSQLQNIDSINNMRMAFWSRYQAAFQKLESDNLVILSKVPPDCIHNAHIFYMLMRTHQAQSDLLNKLKENGISAVFHYVPLHSSDAGIKYGRIGSAMTITDDLPNRLIRLPIYPDLAPAEFDSICKTVKKVIVESAA